MEFETALEILRTSTTPQLPLLVFWQDLRDNAFVDKTTTIGINGVNSISIRQAIKLLLLSVGRGPGNIDCLVRDGVVTIASPTMGLRNEMVTKVYETGELTMPMANVLSGMGMGTLGSLFPDLLGSLQVRVGGVGGE